MDQLPIGRRVAYWRGRRRMSQQVFADRLGKSKSWVDKIERGVRRLDRFSVVHDIADVLQVDVQVLLGRGPENRPDGVNGGCGVDHVELAAIRAAMERYDQVSAFFDAPPRPPQLSEVRKAVNHAWLTYQHARYAVVARSLPTLLSHTQAADASYAGTDQAPEVAGMLGQVYQIASSVLRKVGESDLAWLAADRAVTVAQRAGDQLLAAVAAYRIGLALVGLGRARPALEVNVNIANRVAPGSGNDTTPQRLSVYGMLLLQGAMAAARIGDTATVRDLLRAADEAAARLGGDHNYYWSCFGPTNVQLHRVAAAVELGEGQLAVATHERIDANSFAALLPERRAQHFLDMARGFAQVGDIDRATEMLLAGDRLAPTDIRCRPVVREVIGDVLRRARGEPPPAITDLAVQLGVGG